MGKPYQLLSVGISISLVEKGIEEGNASFPNKRLTCVVRSRRIEPGAVMDRGEQFHVSVDLPDPALRDMENRG